MRLQFIYILPKLNDKKTEAMLKWHEALKFFIDSFQNFIYT